MYRRDSRAVIHTGVGYCLFVSGSYRNLHTDKQGSTLFYCGIYFTLGPGMGNSIVRLPKRLKAIMGNRKVPANSRVCATCNHWLGRQSADYFCQWVEYDTSEKGRCVGGGFQGAAMPGLSSCSQWSQRFRR